jgi:hypothetical protein
MVTAISRRAKLGLVLMGSLCALALGLISGPAPAQAAWSNYCVGWQGGYGYCDGAQRLLYQTYGWGDQGRVCVAVQRGYSQNCSSGAGQGVYSPVWGPGHFFPFISNNTAGANFVHGVALQP